MGLFSPPPVPPLPVSPPLPVLEMPAEVVEKQEPVFVPSVVEDV